MNPPRLLAAAASCALALAWSGCGDTARALGAGPDGPAPALELLDALRARFGPAEREPTLQAARPKLAAAVLVPSRAFDDASVWTAGEGDWKTLWLEGAGRPGAYRLGLRSGEPAPGEPGAYRARVTLRRLGAERFEWSTREALVLGRLRVEDLSAAWRALLRAAEREKDARGSVAAALPRAAGAFGRLFDLEALAVEAAGDGTFSIELGVRVQHERIKPEMPRLAAYLRRRAEGLRMTMAAHGDDGRTLWVAEANEAAWRVRLRVRDGALVPLDGPPARAPGKVRVTINYSFKAGLVRAGVRGLVAEVEPTAEAGERGFTARFVEQPDWQLPFLVEPLLRSSLRYPFEGNGSEFEVALRPESGRTELVGDSRLRLRESWIVRWLGGFTTKALEELRAAEVEADRYALECLTALREDVAERIGQGAIGQPGNRDRERTRGGQGRAMSAGRGAASRAEASGSTACNAGGSPPR